MGSSSKEKQPKEIRAAGGIVWEGEPWKSRVLLIFRHRRRDWCLPKGKLDEGETFEEAAVREILEETGYEVSLGESAGEVHYEVKGRPKTVRYWHTTVDRNAGFEENSEVERIEWLSIDEALERMDYKSEKSLLAKS